MPLLLFAALLEAEAGAEPEEEALLLLPLSPRSALAAAASGAGKSAQSLSPSKSAALLISSVIVEDVGHAKLCSVVEAVLVLMLEAT